MRETNRKKSSWQEEHGQDRDCDHGRAVLACFLSNILGQRSNFDIVTTVVLIGQIEEQVDADLCSSVVIRHPSSPDPSPGCQKRDGISRSDLGFVCVSAVEVDADIEQELDPPFQVNQILMDDMPSP